MSEKTAPIQLCHETSGVPFASQMRAIYKYEGFEGEIGTILFLYLGSAMIYAVRPGECWEMRGSQAMKMFLKREKHGYLHPGDWSFEISVGTLKVLAWATSFCRGVKKILCMRIA